MRWPRLISVLIFSACGFQPTSSASDGGIGDGEHDSALATASRIWVVGDFLTHRIVEAGRFDDDAMLPFGNGRPTPLLVPTGTAVLANESDGYTPLVFDVNSDGTRTAYVADLTVADRFDLYVEDAGVPTLLVAGPSNAEISAIALSPDGSKIAFASDAAMSGAIDLYVIDTSAGASPRLISPARTGGIPVLEDVAPDASWSADSRYVAFSGDLGSDGYDQVYCADTSTMSIAVELLPLAKIATQASGEQGVRGPLLFDANDNAYFTARTIANNPRFQLFRAKPDGSMLSEITSLAPNRSDSSTPDFDTIGITPDGTKLVFSADSPTAMRYDIYVNPIGTAITTNLTQLGMSWHPSFGDPLWFSPDGSQLATVAATTTRLEPYVIPMAGGMLRRLVNVTTSCGGGVACDAQLLQWTIDGTALYAQGDLTTDGTVKLYRLDPTLPDQPPTVAVDVPAASNTLNVLIRPK